MPVVDSTLSVSKQPSVRNREAPDMDGVVLAAGEGTRLRPFTAEQPKGLVEVDGRPILTHCFERLLAVGVERLVVVVGYRADQIRDHYGEQFRETPLRYAHQSQRNGDASALLTAADHVDCDEFVVMHGDNVFETDQARALDRHRATDADATLVVENVSREEATRLGVVELDDDDVVEGLVEKPDDPPSTVATTGFYVLPAAIFDACRQCEPSERGEYELSRAIDHLVSGDRTVVATRLDGERINVNTPEDLRRAEDCLQRSG